MAIAAAEVAGSNSSGFWLNTNRPMKKEAKAMAATIKRREIFRNADVVLISGQRRRMIICPKCDVALFSRDTTEDPAEVVECGGNTGWHKIEFTSPKMKRSEAEARLRELCT